MSQQIKFTITDEIYKQLKKIADKEDRSVSNMCLVLVKKALQDRCPAPIYTPTQPQEVPGSIKPPFIPTSSSTPTHTNTDTHTATSTTSALLEEKIEEHKRELPKPSKPVKFIRPDGEPFTLEDFEAFLPDTTKNDDTYHTLKKHIPSLQLTTILREGATRTTDDFVKFLKEEYQYTLESALGYSPMQTISTNHLKQLAKYLQPQITNI